MEKGVAAAEVMSTQKEEEAAMACYRRTVGEEATFKERSKDLFRQFKDAPVGNHWSCFKNKVRAVGDLFTKDDDSSKKPSAEN